MPLASDIDFRSAALALPGVSEAAHFDRRAYRRRVIFATLPADGRTANLRLPQERQVELVERFPDALCPVENKWGERGWTTLKLDKAGQEDVDYLLKVAFQAAG